MVRVEIVRYLKAAEYSEGSEASALADDSILPFNITIQFNSAMDLQSPSSQRIYRSSINNTGGDSQRILSS